MESEKLNGFVVHIYSPGNQIIQTQNNNYYGTVYQTKNENGQNGFSDEQVAKKWLRLYRLVSAKIR